MTTSTPVVTSTAPLMTPARTMATVKPEDFVSRADEWFGILFVCFGFGCWAVWAVVAVAVKVSFDARQREVLRIRPCNWCVNETLLQV